MSCNCCIFCGQAIGPADETGALRLESGPVCRACRFLTLVQDQEPEPLRDNRQPEAPQYQPDARDLPPPIPLRPQVVLTLV